MNTTETMLARVEAYLKHRRQAGYALKIEGEQLLQFARFADNTGHRGPPTINLAIQWACSSPQSKPITAARRIEVIRPFARHCQQAESGVEIPPGGLFGPGHRRLAPHIFTTTEIRALMKACDN